MGNRHRLVRRLMVLCLSGPMLLPLTACAQDSEAALPGAAPLPAELRERLQRKLEAKGSGYVPRTEHLAPDGRPLFTNRLLLEDSPYLVQHAHNPMNWFPWGPEAFAVARREQKPVFLSIGYSTCHWCHVMEEESFDDVEIARLLNERFVSIKVDRERRPDVDELYMTAVVMLTGRGGWPMSSFLTPAGEPFFGGTYFPRAQFKQLLLRVVEAWEGQRPQLLASAERVAEQVKAAVAGSLEAREFGDRLIQMAVEQSLADHDPDQGGFGGAPKFPREPELLFLLGRVMRNGDEGALAALETSLTAMARGGIHDQVGGGFHRYSTDARWLVPHFEKMLYNQAHLARAYLGAYRLTARPWYGRVARQILDYVLRDMTAPEGAFYSATDADSEGKEGEFFLWTPEAVREALEPEDAELALSLYGVSDQGNLEGKSILHLPRPWADFAAQHSMTLGELLLRLDPIRESLRLARERRPHPLRDEKIVTAWNGMMITALAESHEVHGDGRYLHAALGAAEFLWAHSRSADGALWRVHFDGSASVPAIQEDYAYLTEAFVTLSDASGERLWLQRAREIADGMLERFWDETDGGFFMSARGGDESLIARPKSPDDGAIPSGNSVAVRALAMLAARTGEAAYRQKAEATLNAFAASIERRPSGYAYMLLGADELLRGGAGPLAYGARGAVRAAARLSPREAGQVQLSVELAMAEGWHINAHEPLQPELIPTVLAVGTERGAWHLDAVTYPDPERVRMSFQREPLAVYRGRVALSAQLSWSGGSAGGSAPVAPVTIEIQACDDTRCLRPEELALVVPAARALR